MILAFVLIVAGLAIAVLLSAVVFRMVLGPEEDDE